MRSAGQPGRHKDLNQDEWERAFTWSIVGGDKPGCPAQLRRKFIPALTGSTSKSVVKGLQLITALIAHCAVLVCLLAMPPAGYAADEISESHHGFWTLRCEATGENLTPGCIMFQNLVLKTGGQPVLQFAIGIKPGGGPPTVLLSLPLGIALPPGVTIRIDDGKAANFPVERCEPDGCQAGMKLRDATIDQLRRGHSLEITFFDGQRQPIRMPLSLDGFSSGFEALQEAGTAPASRSDQ